MPYPLSEERIDEIIAQQGNIKIKSDIVKQLEKEGPFTFAAMYAAAVGWNGREERLIIPSVSADMGVVGCDRWLPPWVPDRGNKGNPKVIAEKDHPRPLYVPDRDPRLFGLGVAVLTEGARRAGLRVLQHRRARSAG